jgi:hypothetical protein
VAGYPGGTAFGTVEGTGGAEIAPEEEIDG